jgi:hypothetical protein
LPSGSQLRLEDAPDDPGVLGHLVLIFFWKMPTSTASVGLMWVKANSEAIRAINFSDATDKARHDRMVGLVEGMLEMHKDLAETKTEHEREVIQRQIDATDKEIDKLVYELYGLTEEEIGIVEREGGQ